MSSSPTIQIDAFCPVGIGGTKGIDTAALKVFVGGLSPQQSSQDLFDIFSTFGSIREAVVIPDRFRVRSRCYGFVTFADESSVHKALSSAPRQLTVTLAAANSKPRRAHFNVKHGISGHKPLPNATPNSSTQQTPKKGVYTDPSLFRTANIQPIAPATLYVDGCENYPPQRNSRDHWPNADIKKDYRDLKTVSVSKENDDPNERKSWRLMSVQQEPDKDSYSNFDAENEKDALRSVHSMRWTSMASISNHGTRARSDSASWRRSEHGNEGGQEQEIEDEEFYGAKLTDAESDQLCDILQDQMSEQRASNEWMGATVYPWSPYHPQFVGSLPMHSVSGSNLGPYNPSYGK